MGSHGGATAEEQREILESLGITEQAVGCPILSSMETVKISEVEGFDAHTSFQGPYESGLMKMMTIGIGKQHGAYICHSKGDDHMSYRIGLNGHEIIKHTNIIMGVALIENAFDKTSDIICLTDREIPVEEPKLLLKSKTEMGISAQRIGILDLSDESHGLQNSCYCR